jgi:hypothetical protein
MPEPPDVTEQPLRLSEDLTVTELVVILENVLWRRDNRCSLSIDKGVRDYVVTALRQRNRSTAR